LAMLITVRELQKVHRLDFDETFAPGAIDLGAELHQTTSLDTKGRAEVIEEHRGGRMGIISDIRMVGELSTDVEVACARCLDPVRTRIDRSFDLLYRPLGVDRKGEEAAIHEPDTEIGYYQGDGLELEDVLREQVLLAVPIKLLCDAGCKGLCPHCGHNLNRETCDCAAPQADVRWTALKDLKDKLK
jgi:uncharacterized protein